MGDWGFGNFDNDDAADYVGSLIDRISKELDRFAGKRKMRFGEVLDECMPRLAVLLLLLKGVRMAGGLRRGQLESWRQRVLAGFDRDAADMYDDPKAGRKRRRVIERTFRQLEPFVME